MFKSTQKIDISLQSLECKWTCSLAKNSKVQRTCRMSTKENAQTRKKYLADPNLRSSRPSLLQQNFWGQTAQSLGRKPDTARGGATPLFPVPIRRDSTRCDKINIICVCGFRQWPIKLLILKPLHTRLSITNAGGVYVSQIPAHRSPPPAI